ncbi:MAG: DUF447 family protein [Planctomycetales bacterium]|nr:DUF447 family protein [Planctomycetales bacterium]
MILEGIITTVNEDGSTNISPMGPIVDGETFDRFTLRPFNTSTTYRNLKRVDRGVLHVTDDVLLLAKAAIGPIDPPPDVEVLSPSLHVLRDCCHWFAFTVESIDDDTDRTTIECTVQNRGRVRDFFGFNRAKHAVLEAAILATRLHLIPEQEIRSQLKTLSALVDKTAGASERQAFDLLQAHAEAYWKAS